MFVALACICSGHAASETVQEEHDAEHEERVVHFGESKTLGVGEFL